MKLTILGCGPSTGVPNILGDWGDCDPSEPKNQRSRVSMLVENDAGQRILIDTSPDLRHQLLRHGIERVDAVIWTHDHADHCHGIDDLRVMRYARSNPIPGFASAATSQRLRKRFDYCFAGQYGYPTTIELKQLTEIQLIAGFSCKAVEMPHGPVTSTGLRFEADGRVVVYATDFSEVTSDMKSLFCKSDVLILDCLRRRPHPSHAHVDMAVEIHGSVAAGRTVLTHLDKSLDYRLLAESLPDGVEPAYDGMNISL